MKSLSLLRSLSTQSNFHIILVYLIVLFLGEKGLNHVQQLYLKHLYELKGKKNSNIQEPTTIIRSAKISPETISKSINEEPKAPPKGTSSKK